MSSKTISFSLLFYVNKTKVPKNGGAYTNLTESKKTPSLIFWGKHDVVSLVNLAFDAYNHSGTTCNNKRVFVFQKSAHSPNREEPILFGLQIRAFIETYK
jgi:pimeloyl-ACP methyl ester carboxylesterase